MYYRLTVIGKAQGKVLESKLSIIKKSNQSKKFAKTVYVLTDPPCGSALAYLSVLIESGFVKSYTVSQAVIGKYDVCQELYSKSSSYR